MIVVVMDNFVHWNLVQLDVKFAFFNGFFEKEVYVKEP